MDRITYTVTDYRAVYANVIVGKAKPSVHAFREGGPAGIAVCGFKPRANAAAQCVTLASWLYPGPVACADCTEIVGSEDTGIRATVTDRMTGVIRQQFIVDTEREALTLVEAYADEDFWVAVSTGTRTRRENAARAAEGREAPDGCDDCATGPGPRNLHAAWCPRMAARAAGAATADLVNGDHGDGAHEGRPHPDCAWCNGQTV